MLVSKHLSSVAVDQASSRATREPVVRWLCNGQTADAGVQQIFHVCIEPDNGETIRRQYTVLVYLNDDFIGGATEFPNLKRVVKPQKGKAVLFTNLISAGCENVWSMLDYR